MAHTVFCVRNKKEMEGLDEPPFDSEFGQKIFKNVSKAAWAEWVDRQKMLLNEYRLQPWTPSAQTFLVEQMEEFFFGSGSALPSDFVPPSTDTIRWPAACFERPGHRNAAAWHGDLAPDAAGRMEVAAMRGNSPTWRPPPTHGLFGRTREGKTSL